MFHHLLFRLENLLNVSKTPQPSANESTNNIRPISAAMSITDEEEANHQEFSDDRHERTGSVKFVDQADESKEV